MPALKVFQNILENQEENFSGYALEQPQQQILEKLAAAVYKCDKDGYVTFYNKTAAELWGREPELGKDLWCGSWKIYEPDGVTPMPLDRCPMAIALKEGRSVRGKEIIVERPDGQRINVMPYPDPILDASGKVVAAINLLVDITELKKKENELRESENRYKTMATDLHSALKTEEEFISIASHELKTPLTSLNLYLTVLLQMHPELSDKTTNYLLTRSKVQVSRLIRLLGDLLDISKIRVGKLDLNFEDVSIDKIIEDIIPAYSSTMPSHSITKTGKSTGTVKADKGRIEQVVDNLLMNAVKYSPDANEIIITISESGTNVDVCVQDFGTGISPQNINEIFDNPFNVNAADREMFSRPGPGLYISNDIILRHNGKMWVDSEIGKGSSFYFSLPK